MEITENAYDRAKDLLTREQPDHALAVLEAALCEQPDDAEMWELKGLILHGRRRYAAAARAIEVAAQLAPLKLTARLALGDAYLFSNRPEMARATYCELAGREALPLSLLSGLALGLSRVQEYEPALAICQRAAAMQPNCHHARYAVAYYMSKCGRPPEFVYPILEEVIEMAPQVFCYRVAAATILSRMDAPDRAYLAVADATFDELATVTCRCCLERLIDLLTSAGDNIRAERCREQLASAKQECRRK